MRFDRVGGRKSGIHFQGLTNPGDRPVSLPKLVGTEVRDFLYTEPTADNKFQIHRLQKRLDPAVGIGIEYIALTIHRNYLGPAIDTLPGEVFNPTPGFLDNVRRLLSEITFSADLKDTVEMLIKDGNVIRRLWRDWPGRIINAELLPPDSLTILSKRYVENQGNPDAQPEVIQSRDFYVVNEWKRADGEDRPYKILVNPDDEPAEPNEGEIPEFVLPASSVLHFSMNAQDSNVIDRLDRQTYGVWGESPLDTVLFWSKNKLAIALDHMKWMKMGMPRWVIKIDLGEYLNPNQYEGETMAQKIDRARQTAKEHFDDATASLYYQDDDPSSPTHEKWLPIEPEDFMIHTEGWGIDQKGGSPGPDVSGSIKEANREICSRLGIPMTLLGYQSEGWNNAVSRVTREFMNGMGGGVLRALEKELFRFLKSEFKARKWGSTPEDWEHLYLEYQMDDSQSLAAKATVDTAKASATQALASALIGLVQNQLITPNEARHILATGVGSISQLGDIEGGDEFRKLVQPASIFGSPVGGGAVPISFNKRTRHETADSEYDDMANEICRELMGCLWS